MRKYITPPLLAMLLAAALFFSACSDNSGNAPADLVIPADLMGMVHGSMGSAWTDPGVKDRYDLLESIGVKWILDDLGWGSFQPGDPSIPEADRRKLENRETNAAYWNESVWDNHVKNANESGIKLLAILDYQANWLHGVPTGEKKPFINYLGETEYLDVYEDNCVGSRCVTGDEEIAMFCEYVSRIVTRYDGKHDHGKVDAWRIWNEPNLQPRFWTGTMDEFYKLSKAALATIRAADPEAVIVVGALNSIATAEWIKGLYSSGAANGADFAAFHPYSTNAIGTENNFNFFKENSAPAFRSKVWITEVGHPTGGNMPTKVTQGRMPNYIVKEITLLASGGAQKIFWYQLRDNVPRGNDSDSENWFGLYELEAGVYTPKGFLPHAYQLCAENIPGKTYIKDGLSGLKLPANVQSHYFEGADGKRSLVVWNDSTTVTPTVTITLPAGSNYTLHNPADASSSAIAASSEHALTSRDASNEKVLFFTWDAQ